MTDDERDARLELLTDLVAQTNRSLLQLTDQVSKLAALMDSHLRHDHGYGDDDES